jgi:sigma-54 specific flagellar transcriptional regulator A
MNVQAMDTTPVRMTLRPTSRGKIVGKSQLLTELVENIDRIARANCTVLVTGESGTGKEMLVAAIHDASSRSTGPLVTLNCGAIPENLLESELFGHAKGAFTGAHAARQGRVASAEGGTLFLDEIGEMPLALQVKLLRLLQQREYSPVGDSKTYRCDIRVVAATNRDLEAEVRAGRFREDLYYRLNVIPLHIPPLRERRDDIAALVMHFFRRMREDLGREDLDGFSVEALTLLETYSWPGNIRELQNVVERAVLLAIGPEVSAQDLPMTVRARDVRNGGPAGLPAELPAMGLDLKAVVDEYESNLIRQALARTGGNKNRAAQLLGLNRTTLVEMVKRKRIAS